MRFVFESAKPNHFTKELLKFTFYEIWFHKYMNNLKNQEIVIYKVTVINYNYVTMWWC